jgi:hypothetical protein
MTVHPPEAPQARASSALPPASLMACFLAALAPLVLFWMPLTLLRQLDAFLGFKRPIELAADAALAAWLLCLPALACALFAWGVGRAVPVARRALVTWCLALLAPMWLCVWQFGSSAWAWFRLVSGTALTLTPMTRVAAAALLLTLLAVALRRGLLASAVRRLVPNLLGLRGPLLVALAVSAGLLAWSPPRRSVETRPDPAAEQPVQAPDVYLITLDTVAAADAAVCGDGPTRMPQLRAFARQATCFSRHYTTANFTTPSTATMETGALPWNH